MLAYSRYSRYSRYCTKSHDKATISHDITRYSRYQTVLSKLEEIISTLGRNLQKTLCCAECFLLSRRECRYKSLAGFSICCYATRYSCRSICLLRKRGIYLISSLNEVKAYRICRKANISSSTLTNISTIYVHIFKEYKAKMAESIEHDLL